MRILVPIALVLAVGCTRGAGDPGGQPAAAASEHADESDMERLTRTRRDLIERGSPLGEENDPLEDLRKKFEKLQD